MLPNGETTDFLSRIDENWESFYLKAL